MKRVAKAVSKGVQALKGAADDLHRLGAAGDDALRNIPQDLSIDEATQAMKNASERISAAGNKGRTPNYNNAKGRTDVINEAKPFQVDPNNLPATPEQLNSQSFNNMMSGAAYDATAPKSAPKGPNYKNAKGQKEVVGEPFKADPKNLPATPEQLQQSNQGFNDMMSGAAHDATGPKPVNNTTPRSGKGQKDYTETWESSKKKSWEKAANTTEVRDGSGELAVYESPDQIRAKRIEQGAKQALKQRTLENANKTGWERVKDAASDIWAGSGFNKGTTANRRAYNERLHSQGSNEYIKSNRQFQQMQQNMGIHGTYTGTAEGFEAMHKAKGQADAAAKAAAEAESAARAEEFSQWWAGKADGIATFAKENQMITAAGIAGTAVIGASLLNDD